MKKETKEKKLAELAIEKLVTLYATQADKIEFNSTVAGEEYGLVFRKNGKVIGRVTRETYQSYQSQIGQALKKWQLVVDR